MNKHTRSVSLIDGHIEDITDAEVIKALECCIKNELLCDTKCPGQKFDGDYREDCRISLMKISLDLINRQQEEKETMQEYINCLRAEIERLQEENKNHKSVIEAIEDTINPLPFETDFDKAIKTAKSEAIKEFAEKLMDEVGITPVDDFNYAYVIRSEEIDNLVKEMTEVQE